MLKRSDLPEIVKECGSECKECGECDTVMKTLGRRLSRVYMAKRGSPCIRGSRALETRDKGRWLTSQ
jgi:hypothetical protein